MRLWASSDTLTFEESVSILGKPITLRFSMQAIYMNQQESQTDRWPIGIELPRTSMGPINVATLGRATYLMNGLLERSDTAFHFNSEICFAINGGTSSPWLNELHGKHEGQLMTTLAEVSLYGSELALCSPPYEVIVHAYESLDLVYGSPTFGHWMPATRYEEIGANPDLVGGNVLLADVEVLRRIDETAE